jgi:hypothetical protein
MSGVGTSYQTTWHHISEDNNFLNVPINLFFVAVDYEVIFRII